MDATKEATLARYRKENQAVQPGCIVCAGSSLMERFPLDRLMQESGCDMAIYNRGVSGFVMEELDAALEPCILDLRPARLFINIGTNNLNDPALPVEDLMAQYDRLLARIKAALPQVELYLMAYYPVNPDAATEEMRACLQVRTNQRIAQANAGVQALAARHGARYIDLNDALQDGEGRLKAAFTDEGLHLNEAGYRAIFPAFLQYAGEPAWKR